MTLKAPKKEKMLVVNIAVPRETHKRIRLFAAQRGLRLPDAITLKFSDVELPTIA